MAKQYYRINLEGLSYSEGFREGTREELAVLLHLISLRGEVESVELLATALGISKSRVSAAISLWRESGVLVKLKKGDTPPAQEGNTAASEPASAPKITMEFEDNPLSGDLDDEGALRVAEQLRDPETREVVDEVIRLMNRPVLSTYETQHITALRSQLALSPEYILLLAAHLAERGRLTPQKLSREAIYLTNKGVDTVEDLEAYITNSETMTPAQHELRRIIGFRGRNLSKTEREYLRRWSEDYRYSTTIVEEAFCLATESGAVRILPYMEKLLKKWHDAGCLTLEECRRVQEEELAEREAKRKEKETEKEKEKEAKTRKGRKDTAKTPKYTEFDSEDALMKALARSYGDSGANGTESDTPPADGDEN